MSILGRYVRKRRQALQSRHEGFSIRGLAERIGMHHSYLSKLERGENAPLAEGRIHALARELGEAPELLMVMSGKFPDRLARLVAENADLFTQFMLDLEQRAGADGERHAHAARLARRARDLELLTQALRDEIARRRRLELRLSQQEKEQRTILANLKDVGVEYLDRDLTLLWASDALLHLCGCTLQDAVGKRCHQVLHGRDAPCPDCSSLRARETGQVQEERRVSPDGNVWQVRTVPIADERGEVVRIVRFGFNITELLRAKQALADSELRWKFALEGAREGVWDWNAVTNAVYYSPRWKEMLGYEEHEIGDSLEEWRSRVHPEDLDATMAAVNAHLRQETPFYQCEHRLRCKDGSYIWILDRGIIVERDDQGAPLRVIGTHFDITESREQQQRMEADKRFLDALFQSIQDGICVLDRDLNVAFVNAVMERWHAPDMPLVGKKCHQAFHRAAAPCPACPALECLRTGKARSTELEVPTALGMHWLELHCYPIRDEHGAVTGVMEFARDVTRRKRLEEDQASRERLHRALFEKNPTVQLLIDPETGAIVDANPAACDFYGWPCEELTRMTIHEINTLSRREVDDEMLAATREARSFFLFRHRLRDGTERAVEVRVSPLDIGGKTLLHSLVVDVSQRAEAQNALRTAEFKFRGLFEHAPVGICLVGPDDRLLAVNRSMAAMFDYPSPEAMLAEVSHASRLFDDPADLDRVLAIVRRFGAVKGFECLSVKRGGQRFWTARSGAAVRDAAGETLHHEVFVEDIQGRKEAEMASEAARRQLMSVLEHLEAGVYVMDAETLELLYVNPYLQRALGTNPTGRPSTSMLRDPGQACPFLSRDGHFVNEQTVHSVELTFSNDHVYLCTARLASWRRGLTELAPRPAVLVMAADITAMKEAEKTREDMFRMMQHDLKSPLNGVICLPELLMEQGSRSDAERDLLRAIAYSGRKMLGLVDAALSLHKLESGTYALSLHPMDLFKEVQAVLVELQQLVASRRLQVRTSMPSRPASLSRLLGDRVLLPAMLANLIKNALEAAPRESTVHIRLEEDPRSGLALHLHHEGQVPEPMRRRFFQKYATHGKAKGTGLGNYSARLMARAHGGDIVLSCEPGEGVTVTVFLPASLVNQPDA